MKTRTTLITILFISLLCSPSWSETVSMDDLVERGNLFYKKFTDVPFSGQVTGQFQGSIENGKEEGCWSTYFKNGQLSKKGIYENGNPDGTWAHYKYDKDRGEYFRKLEIWEQGNRISRTYPQIMVGRPEFLTEEDISEAKAYAKKLKAENCAIPHTLAP